MLDSLEPFVSRHLLSLIAADRTSVTLDATLVFGDVAGFTALNERLSKLGREGAERMVDLLDAVFGQALETANSFGGDLWKFGGDALLIAFDGPGHVERAAAAAMAMQKGMSRRTAAHKAIGRTRLSMSMGLETGRVTMLRCGDLASEPVVYGQALEETLRRESDAVAGEILLGPAAAAALAEYAVPGDRGTKLDRAPDVPPATYSPRPFADVEALSHRAMSEPLRAHLSDPDRFAEHRPVTTAFVRYDTKPDESPRAAHARIGRIVEVAQRACQEEGVTFVMADVGVGNGKLLLSGGAPHSLGDSTDRMLDVALRITGELGAQVAIGINAGVIFCGEVGGATQKSYAAIGDAVNLAARVTARAQPGQVLCEASSFGDARGTYETTSVAPFQAKGKRRAVETLSIRRPGRTHRTAKDLRGDEVRRSDAPIEGREQDVAILVAGAAAVAEGGTRVIQIIAPAGMGKSTVVDAALDAARGLHTITMSGGRYSRLSPWASIEGPLHDLLGLRCELDEPGASDELLKVIANHCPEVAPWAPFIGMVLGIDVPSTPESEGVKPRFRARRTHASILALVSALATSALAMVIDDAQWLDESTVGFLEYLADERPPFLLMVSARRPEDTGLLLTPDRVDHTITLGPLADDVALRIVRRRAESLNPRVAAALVERAGGHPLFLVALIEAALNDDEAELPTTVEDALRAELDRLGSRVRWLLGQAAVLGMHSDLDLLARSSATSIDEMRTELAEGASFVDLGSAAYRFSHPLRRDAAYQGLPVRERRQAHARAAAALLDASDHPPAQLMSLHYFESSQHDASWVWSRKAADEARRAFAPSTESTALKRALESAARSPHVTAVERADVLEQLGGAYEVMALFNQAETAYRQACRLDPSPRATTRRRTMIARVCRDAGNIRRGLRWVAKAEQDAESLPPADRAFPQRERAALLFRRGDLRGALRAAEAAADLARRGRDDRQLAESLRNIGTIRELTGSNGLADLRQSIRLYERSNNPRGAASAYNNLAAAEYDRGMWDLAIEHYELCAQRAESVGDLILAATALNNLAEVQSDRGELDRARPVFDEACHTWTSVDYRIGRGVALNNLGRLNRRSGALEDAVAAFDEALEIFAEIEAHDYVAETWLRRAEVALAAGDAEQCVVDLTRATEGGAVIELGAPFNSAIHRLAAIAALHHGDHDTFQQELARASSFSSGLRYEAALVLEVRSVVSPESSTRAEAQLEAAFDALGIVDSGQRQLLPPAGSTA